MAQWLAPYMGYTIGIPKFFSEYIWYIIYLVVWITIFSHQNIKYNFTKIEWAWGFGGLLLGVRGRNSDNQLIQEKLNWRPTKPLKEGLAETYKWVNEQHNKL